MKVKATPRLIAFVHALATNIFLIVFLASAGAAELTVVAKAAVLMDLNSGQVLWAKQKDLRLPPASTVKILTAQVVLEREALSKIVAVPPAATAVTGATMRLQAGEQLTVEQLLYALLLGSANDAATALAAHTAGSVAKFANLMNQKARQLGARRSHFVNPTGMPHREQMTSAYDLALITKAALTNADFRRIVATKTYQWKTAQWHGVLKNSNLLLENYAGAIGVKTGSTKEAGYCLVAAAKRHNRGYIAVVLNSREKTVWQDGEKLLDHGFK